MIQLLKISVIVALAGLILLAVFGCASGPFGASPSNPMPERAPAPREGIR